MNKSLFRKKSVSKLLEDLASGYGDGENQHGASLNKVLRTKDLTFMGIAAVIGAGIFSTIGVASFNGGPGVTILFVITAVTCGFSALCYAEFASRIPVSGSAYTYAYASFGELIAWIIGWDLLMEYAIGNIAVAISWSKYFTNLLEGFHIHIPGFLTMDYLSAYRGFGQLEKLKVSGAAIDENVRLAAAAWSSAPQIGSLKLIADVPALFIVFMITWLVYVGIRETKKATNAMVILKIAVVLGVIILGAFYIQPTNWHPFLPNGFSGVMKGVSGVFFAYIGFDAISTTAEECENPQRDLPRGMIYSLIICTVLYILIALVLTGMVNYKELRVEDPLAFVFARIGLKNISYVISISAVVATASVLLIFQMGQPRIWMSMSRDGLLPKAFSRIHPKYQTPSFATIVTGFVVAIPALFLNLTEVTDLTSIGTLFAFVLVCGGVLLLPKDDEVQADITLAENKQFKTDSSNNSVEYESLPSDPDTYIPADIGDGNLESKAISKQQAKLNQQSHKKFKIPYVNSKYIVPVLFLIGVVAFWKPFTALFHYTGDQDKLPYFLFFGLSAVLAVLSFLKNLSLIPVLGLLSCFYLMTELGYTNWLRFLIWLVIGLVIYFTYSYKHSKLNSAE